MAHLRVCRRTYSGAASVSKEAHVGSLSRPDPLVASLTVKDRGQPYDRDAYIRRKR